MRTKPMALSMVCERFLFRLAIALAALLALAPAQAVPAAEGALPGLNAALLVDELGDPRAPGNVKLAVGLPGVPLSRLADVGPEDFRIYVHPAGLTREEGLAERYRAGGVYLWRNRADIFLDARVVPVQEREGRAVVRVIYAPGGAPAMEGMAEGRLRYASDLVDVVLAVDVSRSMLYNDPRKLRVAAARSFIDMSRRGGGIGRVGLVTFNHRANRETPLLPLDAGETLIQALNRVGAEGLTNLDHPLETAFDELRESRRGAIILLSDGKNEGSVYKDTHLRAAELGVRIFTVGLSEQADHNLLRAMADASGGIYFRAVKDSDLPDIYARLAAELGKRRLLHAETLEEAEGATILPIDSSVKRLVVMADGGARVGAAKVGGPARDKGGMFTDGMSGVQMGRPEPGDWEYSWDGATSGVSTLSLFGETQFFLDVFPPQLIGNTLSLGVTLARGEDPLAGADVHVEPVPGVFDRPLVLHDDGQHGDGLAGDGVYAGTLALPDAPERLALEVRAAGAAWDEGERFVRQGAGLAVRVPEPAPEAVARIGGEVDFGVLFPGETGSAVARIDLAAREPRELSMDLSWHGTGEEWPDYSSSVLVPPGEHSYRLEITVPENAVPGRYDGSFSVSDGGDVGDTSGARVTVGTITFEHPGDVDLGAVPPGTFVSRQVTVPYAADKAAPLQCRIYGPEDLNVTLLASRVEAGRGEVAFEATVSAPIGMKDGEYSGRVVLSAGPGSVEIPLYWRVRPYAVKQPGTTPVPGLPRAPKLPEGTKPLEQSRPSDLAAWPSREGEDRALPLDSPWEHAGKLFGDPDRAAGREPGGESGLGAGRETGLETGREPGAGAGRPDASSGFAFPAVEKETDESGPGFWSAWWLYLLAALLLLLLLLLLLAYILYRLGKSHLARLLLASAIANIILLIAFILLLSVVESAVPEPVRTVTVTLVKDDLPAEMQLTRTERDLLDGASLDSEKAAGGGGAEAKLGEVAMAAAAEAAAAAGGRLVTEKQVNLPDGNGAEMRLADANEASAMPLENRSDRSLRRRERASERSAAVPESVSDLPEMAEPRQGGGERQNRLPEVGEARLDIEAADASERPVWSDGDRPLQPMANEQGVLTSRSAGMEKITLDRAASRVEPRGRRSNSREMPSVNPEPRSDIADPMRDASEAASRDAHEAVREDPGVEEVRVAARSIGPSLAGEKTGSLLPPGASRLDDARDDLAARGLSVADGAERSRPRGGLRPTRGGANREGTALTSPQSADMPGGERGERQAAAAGGSTGSRQGGSVVGETRFDAEDGGAPGGADGVPDGMGAARSPAALAAAGGGGVSPSPLSAGGGAGRDAARAEFAPGAGDGGGLAGGPSRGGQARLGDRAGGGSPEGRSGIPGGDGLSGDRGLPGAQGRPGGSGSERGLGGGTSGRGQGGGVGEGRFDDMASGGGGTGMDSRAGGGLPGVGRSDLSGIGGDVGLSVVLLDTDDGEWRRNDRRELRRAVAVAASSIEADGLLIVVGDFSRLPDAASENLFASLSQRLARGIAMEERRLSPLDANLSDTLLAVLSPDAARDWSDADVAKIAEYLRRGGHIWLDAADRGQTAPVMERLARATGGDFAPLDPAHQLSDGEDVDAVTRDGKLLVVATRQGWRGDWRQGRGGNGRALRFLVRGMNYFLSGNADTGITLDTPELEGGRMIQPYSEVIPERLAGAPAAAGILWDDFGPASAASWRMPSWSDPGRIAAVFDGEGGRALKMDLGPSAKGRAAVYRTLNPAQDMGGVMHIALDAYYDGGGDATLSMVFTIRENGAWNDYETPPATLRTGWNRLRFALTGDGFRALSAGGGVGPAPSAREVGRAGFFVYRESGAPAMLLFRDIRLNGK